MASPSLPPVLHAFAFTEWPDLTCDRAPPPKTHVSTSPLPTAFSQKQDRAQSLLLLALARILGTYCGTSDLLLACETDVPAKHILVRAQWSSEQTWGDVALRISSQLRAGPDGQYTVPELRNALGLQDKQYPCLAALTLQNHPTSASEFPLNIFYDVPTSTLSLASSSTFIHPTVSDQLLAQVTLLLEHVLANPTSTLSPLPRLPNTLSSVYDRAADNEISKIYPHISQVEFATDYVRQRAISHPHSVAVRWFPDLSDDNPFASSESTTYAQLDENSSRVARWLVSRGLKPEDRVALCLSRDLFFHAAMIGIMRAGGCYVPIDPDLPTERKAYIARDSNAAFVLTTSQLSPPDLFGSVAVYVDEPGNKRAIEKEDGSLFNIATVDGLSYMLYTSGTTGNPKGCLLTNKGLAQAILALSSTAAQVRMQNLRTGRYLAVASIAFDVHLAETFCPMALGMPLFSAPRSELLENLPYYVNTLQITHLGIVPSLIEATLNAASDDDGKTNLRYIASGGEKMSDAILDKWANHPQVRLANFYGPSEVTIGCAARYMDSNTPKANIGRPFANVSGYVVDSDLQILPRGGVGELIVEGPLVGRGYHGRPDLTKKVFLEWPEEGCWAYRTGDLVRMLPDSTIEILGRIDTQIKLRGVRIESEGVSAIVRKAAPPSPEFVLDATTILAKHPAIGNDQLVSFVTWNPNVTIAARKSTRPTIAIPPKGLLSSIRDICNAELASYMRPSHIIPVTWLPLSSNGKTDAKICRDIFLNLSVQEVMALMAEDKAEASATCSEVEEAVFSILQQHASHPGPAYPDLSVFECGLDSLAVIRFTSDLKERFNRQLSASDVMKHPMLKDIARLLEAPSQSIDRDISEELVPASAIEEVYEGYPTGSVEAVFPPFPIQQGVVSRSAELDTLYVQHLIVQCRGTISATGLKKAWRTVIDRHPMLRTVFFIDQLMLQVVLKPGCASDVWSERSWDIETDRFVEEFYKADAERITKEINQSISSVPPLRTTLYTLRTSVVFVLSIHHALYDGVCLPLIMSDAESAYLGSEMLPLASLKNILACISAHEETASRQFWTAQFSGFKKQISPFNDDWQESSVESGGMVRNFKSSLSSLKAVAARQQVTLQALLSHAFAKLVATGLYRSRDVCFGVIRSGRLLPVDHIESAICPTISLLPVRVDFDREGSSLAHIQAGISEMVDYENVPLSQIQSWVRPGETLFDVVFSISVHHNATSKVFVSLDEHPPKADYPLAVEAVLHPEEDLVVIRAAWLQGYLTEDFVSRVLSDFEASALDTEGLTGVPIPSTSFDGSQPSTSPASSTVSLHTEIVDQLRHMTSEFLRISQDMVTEKSSFISLGLDSIKAVGLAKRITKSGYKVTSIEILKAATVQKLADVISSRASGPSPSHGPSSVTDAYDATMKEIKPMINVTTLKLSDNDEPSVFPATALQAGMLSQTIASSGGLYVHNFPMLLTPGTDLDRLHTVWKIATDMFSILRTSFHFIQNKGVWTQVVHSRYRLDWEEEEINTDAQFKVASDAFVSSIVLDEESSFSRPPVWLRLYRPCNAASPSVRPRLVLVMHHALYDGISVGKLLYSIECLYRGDPLPSTVHFSSLLPEILRQEADGTPFWVRHLQGFKHSPLPNQTQGKAVYIEEKTTALDSQLVLSALSEVNVTLQCLFQVALARLLSSLTGSSDVVFGHVVSGRSIAGSEDVIGPMLNTIPCRVKLEESETKLLGQVHRSNLEVSSWQQASLRSIQKALGVDRLWDCLFTFQPLASDGGSMWSLETADEHKLQIQYSLHVEVEQIPSGFIVRAAAGSDGFASRTLATLVGEFSGLVTSILESVRTGASVTSAATKAYKLPPKVPVDDSQHPLAPPVHVPRAPPVISSTTPIPAALLKVLSEVVPDMKDLKLDTPLASLGIDSITAIQVSGKLRLAGHRLKTADLVSSRTLGDVVAKLSPKSSVPATPDKVDRKVDGNGVVGENAVSKVEYDSIVARFGDLGSHIEQILPMAPGMMYLLSGWQRAGASRFQNVFPYRLPADVDAARLQSAWKLVIRRHQMLRSTPATAPGSGEPRLVTFNANYDFENWAEETLPDDNFHHHLIDRFAHCSRNPLNVNQPPVGARLFRSQSRSLAYIGIHINHVLYDGMAIHMITRCLSDMYRIAHPTTDGDASRFLGRFPLDEATLSLQKSYWRSVLPSPFRPVLFPRLDIPRPLAMPKYLKRHTIADTSLTISAVKADRLARAQGTNLNAVCIAVWAAVHAKYANAASATFGLWTAARTGLVEDMENLVVPAVNIVPMHVPLMGDVLETSRHVRQDLLNRTAEVDQSSFDDIIRFTNTEGGILLNTTLNVLRIPNVSQTDTLLEPVTGPYECPPIYAMTVTPTLDEIAYTRNHTQDLMVEVAIVERLGRIYVAIDGDNLWMTGDQTKKVLDDYVNALKTALVALENPALPA